MIPKFFAKNGFDDRIAMGAVHNLVIRETVVLFSFAGKRLHFHVEGLSMTALSEQDLRELYAVVRPCLLDGCQPKETE